jgi:hypothetical protein
MKLTITLPDGRKAWTERGTWSSADPGFGTYCTIFTAKEAAANPVSLAFLESANRTSDPSQVVLPWAPVFQRIHAPDTRSARVVLPPLQKLRGQQRTGLSSAKSERCE